MSEEREEVYQILELGKHLKNLHHKKGFGGLLFIDLSMIKFSKLSSYIRQLDKENEELKQQLHDASIQIQELIEKDIWCPSNCEKLEKLQQENNQLKELIDTILNWNIFKNECPMNFGYDEETNEDKAQDVFYKDDDYCENNCNDDYTKCWLKYFKRMQELEKGDSNE